MVQQLELATASAEQVTACLRAWPLTLVTAATTADPPVTYDIPSSFVSAFFRIAPHNTHPPFILTVDEMNSVASDWAALPDSEKLDWYRGAVLAPMWADYVSKQHASFRVGLFRLFGASPDAATDVQTALADAIEQAPRASLAAEELISNTYIRSDPEIRKRISDLAELSTMGQDDTLRAIVQGFRPELPAGEYRFFSHCCGLLPSRHVL
jgi:hypothetical protein